MTVIPKIRFNLLVCFFPVREKYHKIRKSTFFSTIIFTLLMTVFTRVILFSKHEEIIIYLIKRTEAKIFVKIFAFTYSDTMVDTHLMKYCEEPWGDTRSMHRPQYRSVCHKFYILLLHVKLRDQN